MRGANIVQETLGKNPNPPPSKIHGKIGDMNMESRVWSLDVKRGFIGEGPWNLKPPGYDVSAKLKHSTDPVIYFPPKRHHSNSHPIPSLSPSSFRFHQKRHHLHNNITISERGFFHLRAQYFCPEFLACLPENGTYFTKKKNKYFA